MARTRYLKPDTASDTKLAEVSRDARLLYRDLWCHMDRQGITEDDPRLIKRNVFPYDDDLTVEHVGKLIDELIRIGRLLRFNYSGKALLWCPTFAKHQNFHKDEKARFYIPQEKLEDAVRHGASTMLAPGQHQLSTLPTTTNARASTTGTGTGTITGTGTATPPSPRVTTEEIQLAKETWVTTLEAFGIHGKKLGHLEEIEIARAIQAYGGDLVLLALEGVRYDAKGGKFNRSDHLNLATILDRAKIQSHANRALSRRSKDPGGLAGNPSEDLAC